MDSHSYLRYDLAHLMICKSRIPYSQFLRVQRICSNKEDYDQNAWEMAGFFLARGYPAKVILIRYKERWLMMQWEVTSAGVTTVALRTLISKVWILQYHPQTLNMVCR